MIFFGLFVRPAPPQRCLDTHKTPDAQPGGPNDPRLPSSLIWRVFVNIPRLGVVDRPMRLRCTEKYPLLPSLLLHLLPLLSYYFSFPSCTPLGLQGLRLVKGRKPSPLYSESVLVLVTVPCISLSHSFSSTAALHLSSNHDRSFYPTRDFHLTRSSRGTTRRAVLAVLSLWFQHADHPGRSGPGCL